MHLDRSGTKYILCPLKMQAVSKNRRCNVKNMDCLLYTSDAADERSSVDLGGSRIIKKKNRTKDSS